MSSVVVFPFHQDERLGSDNIPAPADSAATFVEPDLPAGDRWQRLLALYDQLASQVAATVASSPFMTVLSGDCLPVLGVLAGAQRAGLDPCLVWVDAHGDAHTIASSTSGYLGGMALRMAVGGDADKLA